VKLPIESPKKKQGRFFIPPNKNITDEELKKISFKKLNLENKLVSKMKKE